MAQLVMLAGLGGGTRLATALQSNVCRDAVSISSHGNCGSVPHVGWSLRASLAFTAALGLSGCLLFTDPINKAPVVKFLLVTNPVAFGIPAEFRVTVTDDKDNLPPLLVDWGEFNYPTQGCDSITNATWGSATKPTTLDSSASYLLTADSMAPACLCARATDHNGATGLNCVKITPVPVATIVDVSGVPSGQQRRLCSQVHLSAENSSFPVGDKVDFKWSIQYEGADSAGKSVQLAACTTGVPTGKAEQHRCFTAGSPGVSTVGTYTVKLTIADTFVVNSASTSVPSDPATFVIPVNKDTPPCLQRTDPDAYARRILLSRNPDLSGTYQSRTFKVLSVDDDCEPYPLPAGSTNPSSLFVWSVLDSTKASPTWTYQTNDSDSFTISQAQFPNARPGDTIQLRVEVRDLVVQKVYQSGGSVCAQDTVDICCGSNACGTPNDCIRWTTWMVQFQP